MPLFEKNQATLFVCKLPITFPGNCVTTVTVDRHVVIGSHGRRSGGCRKTKASGTKGAGQRQWTACHARCGSGRGATTTEPQSSANMPGTTMRLGRAGRGGKRSLGTEGKGARWGEDLLGRWKCKSCRLFGKCCCSCVPCHHDWSSLSCHAGMRAEAEGAHPRTLPSPPRRDVSGGTR